MKMLEKKGGDGYLKNTKRLVAVATKSKKKSTNGRENVPKKKKSVREGWYGIILQVCVFGEIIKKKKREISKIRIW